MNNFSGDRSSKLRNQLGRDVVFGHFRVDFNSNLRNRSGKIVPGHVCVALLRPPKGSNSTEYKAAVSFCSPMDSPNRRIARDIALGRLMSEREGRNFIFTSKAEKLAEVFEAALQRAVYEGFVVPKGHQEVPYAPLWLREALANSGTIVAE